MNESREMGSIAKYSGAALAINESGRIVCGVNFPLFVGEVLVHEGSESVGVAKVTYYPIDGMLKGIRIGLELKNGTRRAFPLVELRRASPDETATLEFVPEVVD